MVGSSNRTPGSNAWATSATWLWSSPDSSKAPPGRSAAREVGKALGIEPVQIDLDLRAPLPRAQPAQLAHELLVVPRRWQAGDGAEK